MNPWFLYIIPVAIVVLGTLYAKHQQSQGLAALAAAATVAMSWVLGIALLVGIITYHVTKNILWSVLSVPAVFVILFLILKFLLA